MVIARCKKVDRVKCLATRFDTEENKDSQGRLWSTVYISKEKTKWCRGTVQSLLGGRRFAGNYRVKYDGDNRAYTSHESHLEPTGAVGDDSDNESDDSSERDDTSIGEALSEEGRDPEAGMSDGDQEEEG